ncbi:MAG: hypothetical protein LBF93_11610, partial [Zoogloeaceae bacterium]|nr:hypothetical protein [Zoogloeaceae bacterium]
LIAVTIYHAEGKKQNCRKIREAAKIALHDSDRAGAPGNPLFRPLAAGRPLKKGNAMNISGFGGFRDHALQQEIGDSPSGLSV